MRYNELINALQNLTKEKLTDRKLMSALGLKSPSTVLYKRTNNSFITDDEVEKIEQYFDVSLPNSTGSKNYISIPVRGEVEASMGYGVEVYNESQTGVYSISHKLANDLGIDKSNSEIIFGRGNSMEPTILGGDALLIDRSKREINDGRIYCIRYDGQLLTKRLQRLSRKKIKIISDNTVYDPIVVDFEKEIDVDFEVIGEIRWSGRIFR